MPGFEVIGNEEQIEINQLFEDSKILFRHSFDNLRNNIYKVKEFEEDFASRMKIPHALGVTSGTAALRVALAALDIKEGDEIITQSFTFVATVEAIIESKAIPVIAEIDETLNLDPDDIENKITTKTKAIIAVHMLGVPSRLKEIKAIAKKHNLFLIEDTAWGCGGNYQNTPLGTHGDVGTFSFDFAKTITTGEGGMIVFKDKNLYDKASAWHDHGHENNPKLPRWEDSRSSSGFNFRMNEMQGAVGIAQLKKLDYIVKKQRENAALIADAIRDMSLKFRKVPNESYETCDALTFFVDNNDIAIRCRESLLKSGVGTKILPEAISWHFAGKWSHMPELYNNLSCDLSDAFPKSLAILNRSVSLPINVKMDNSLPLIIRNALSLVL